MLEIRNLRKFNADLDKFAERIGVDVTLVVKKLSFDIFADVVAGTPVDTGRAMNNWAITIGSPSRTIKEGGGSPASMIGSAPGKAAAALASLRPFDVVWISNNLPYIGFLEEGSSKQAPNGWVAKAVFNNLQQLARFAS